MRKQLFLGILFVMGLCQIHSVQAQTFKDVAPIIYNNCTSCHHSGGVCFSLTGYMDWLNWGNNASNAIQNGNMPPWPADPTYRHYAKERVLSASDKTALLNWISNGMQAGDTTLAPPPPSYGNFQLYGTPDLVLNLPAVTSTASTQDIYVCVNVPVNITQDRYIRAFEFIPDNAALVHHAVITIDTTGTAVDDLSGGCYNFQGQINIGDFAPGMGPTVLPFTPPAKFGFRLKQGSKMSFQLHIPEGTSGQLVQGQLRIFLYPLNETGIRPMLFETALQNWSFVIPANGTLTASAKYPAGNAGLPVDVSSFACFPHSHQTCTSIINYAYKGTDTIPLVRIPTWDFHWQGQYIFKNLQKIPATYKLYGIHEFDNTINNPNTPNPNVPVIAGTNTNDEMLFDSFLYSIYQSGDENINIENLLLNDPLFFPTGLDRITAIPEFSIHPNPVEETLNISFTLATAQFVKIGITDMMGNQIWSKSLGSLSSGNKDFQLANSNLGLKTGNYLISIQAGNDRRSQVFTVK